MKLKLEAELEQRLKVSNLQNFPHQIEINLTLFP